MTEAYQKKGYRIRRKRSDGQTTVEYLVILLVMIGLLIAIALFFSPRLRNAVKDLVARIECALNVGGGSGCGAPDQGTSAIGSGSAGSTGQGGSGGSGGAGGSGGSSSGGPASSGGAGTFSGGGSSSSGGSFSPGGTSSSGGTGSVGGSSGGQASSSSSSQPSISGNYTGSAFVGSGGGAGLRITQSSFTQNGNTISGYMIISCACGGQIREDFRGTVNGSNISFNGTQLTNISMSPSVFATYRPDFFVGTIQPNGTLVGQNHDAWGNNGTFQLTR